MMRRVLAILLFVLTVGTVTAETYSFDFKNPEVTGTNTNWNGAEPWENAFAKDCKARKDGVGIAPGDQQSGLLWEPNLTLTTIQVTCYASTKTAQGMSHTLGIRYNGTLETFEVPLNEHNPTEVLFLLPSPTFVTELVITNETPSSSTLFEVQEIVCTSGYPEITAKANPPSNVLNGENVFVEIESLDGGSYEYLSAEWQWMLNGESYNDITYAVDLSDFSALLKLTAPYENNTYDLVLTVCDSNGTTATFSYPITVHSHRAANNLKLSDITREQATLTWDVPPGDSPGQFQLTVLPQGAHDIISDKLTLSSVPTYIDLTHWTEGHSYNAAYLILSTNIEVSTDEVTWSEGTLFGSRYILSATPIWVRTQEVTSAQLYITLNDAPVVKKNIPADGTRSVTFDGLSAGRSYELNFTTTYGNFTLYSSPLHFSTPSIPPFKDLHYSPIPGTENTYGLYLTWPEDVTSGSAEYWYETTVTPNVPSGLYLTHLYLTNTPSTKAIVISNNTSTPIHLNGTYTLVSRRERTESENKTDPIIKTWDFSVDKTYPYTVPANSSLIFFAQNLNLPIDINNYENIYTSTTTAISNITKAYTVSLHKNNIPINSLTPTLNTVTKLIPDSLELDQPTPIEDKTRIPLALCKPWAPQPEKVFYRRTTFKSTSQMLYYALPNIPNLSRFWVEARTHHNDASSTPTTLILFRRASGYSFRLK